MDIMPVLTVFFTLSLLPGQGGVGPIGTTGATGAMGIKGEKGNTGIAGLEGRRVRTSVELTCKQNYSADSKQCV